jgi:hypothetical protein
MTDASKITHRRKLLIAPTRPLNHVFRQFIEKKLPERFSCPTIVRLTSNIILVVSQLCERRKFS